MKILIHGLLAAFLVTAAAAERQTFTADPNASEVAITLKTNHEVVHGRFHLESGNVNFDRSARQMSGLFVVLAGSGKTGNETRDKRMDKEILLVAQHAKIAFAPKTYEGTLTPSGDSSLQVTGTFTLLDTAHEITVPMTVHLENGRASIKAHFEIPYVQWGLKDPSLLFWRADKDVAIDLSLAGQVSPAAQ